MEADGAFMAAQRKNSERREPASERDDESPRKSRKKKSSSNSSSGGKQRSRLGRVVYWSLVLGLWAFIGAIGVIGWVAAHLPPIQSLEVPKRPPSVQIVGLNGRVLATRGEMGGSAVPLRELPPFFPKAFLAIEDRRFYSHHGLDPLGVARAGIANVLHRGVSQGGSTITQQLAKNLFLTQERTVTRKLQEAILAVWLERKFSKDEILELYLNRVYFGSGAYGVEAAAQRYFGKSAKQVTLPEAALLAGLVKSPSKLAPTRNFDGAERRAQIVLAAMAEAGFVTDDSAKVAMMSPPKIVKQTAGGSLNYVADWVMDVLNDLVGHVEQDVVVETTIDPMLQAAAEKALIEEIAAKGAKFDVEQGAMVAMTPQGAVRALVGGRNYAESQFNRAVAAKRQPGSAFKPFVYLTALERGLAPDTVREDKPIEVKGWRPENYSREYFGPVTLTRALALSLNTVAVRLTLEVGPNAVVRTAHRLGIMSKLEPNASIGARHLRSLSDRARLGLCAVRERRHRGRAARDRARAHRRRQASLSRAQSRAGPRDRRAPRRDDEPDDAGDAGHRHGAQGRPRRHPGGGQDRHIAGFPRRLVRRLHRPSRHRCMARQRRQHGHQSDRWQPAGRDLEPLHEGRAPGPAGRRSAGRRHPHVRADAAARNDPLDDAVLGADDLAALALAGSAAGARGRHASAGADRGGTASGRGRCASTRCAAARPHAARGAASAGRRGAAATAQGPAETADRHGKPRQFHPR